ncbi:hypothetical protein SDC9_189930 [bioreactor metagenome]|uniref:Uncharacterized protein n=1 Tax=bioreactor metagenome TaxID=1076179 RepID=A0A645I4G7_9ZZZZ
MNRDTIGEFQLINMCIVKHCKPFVVEDHAQGAVVLVNLVDGAKIAVKRACAVLATAVWQLLAPFDLVVVLHLHHTVALAENRISADVLMLMGSWRVERRLQLCVDVIDAQHAFFHRR